MAIAIGTRIGPYEVVGWLGAGGMGVVYRARDARLERDVAIKLIPETLATDPGRLRRFEQEARAAGRLNHPNILAVFDVGNHEGEPYIVSELLEGESLRSRLHGEALPPRRAVDYARQIAEGLAAAHDKGIVHRDLKPDNVFVTSEGRIKILDFGLAKLTQPSADSSAHSRLVTETEPGIVMGTVGYMSPEQARGEDVDHRSDIFSFGAILYEMLRGRAAFVRPSPAETMAAVLKEEPPFSGATEIPPALDRIVSRCLEKSREMRFQSARDLAFGLEVLSDTAVAPIAADIESMPQRRRAMAGVAGVIVSLIIAAAIWLTWNRAPSQVENPLADAVFTPLAAWEGAEEGAEISPDGKWVAFLSDKDGEFDLWVSQVSTRDVTNLTKTFPALTSSGFIVRKLGFSGDGGEIWFNPGDTKPLMLMPLTGGTPRPFLREGANTPAWNPDGTRLVYFFKGTAGDPMFVADRRGANPEQLMAPDDRGMLHNNNPVWSPDGEWIYFVRGVEPQDEMNVDVWRVRASGGAPERLTDQHAAVNFLAPLDARTLLYVSRAEDWSGPWLWALDVERKMARRLSLGPDQYTSVAASRNGRRIVATIANPTASLWQVPVLRDRAAEERDVRPYALPVATVRASAPRFAATTMFYLSARGSGDGLWKVQDGHASEVWRGVDGALFEPPAVSPDGRRVIVVVRQAGKRHLTMMSADGTNGQAFGATIDIESAAGQSAADWSPDGTQIVAGGRDAKGPALFTIPVDGGAPVRLVEGKWTNPIWSPDGKLIVYGGRSVVGQVELHGVRPDGALVELPQVQVRPGGYRFLRDGTGLVYLPRIQGLDFWLLDFATKKTRPLATVGNQGVLRTFDVTPDGRNIVFDRSRQNSNVVLIDRPQ